MDYEYVALTWGENALSDGKFGMARAALIRRGWEEYIRAYRPGSAESGACIMRRPKDEPRMRRPHWTDPNIDWLAQNVFKRLSPLDSGLVCIGAQQIRNALKQALTMPGHEDEPSKDDEPRVWTKREIQEIVRTTPVVTYASE